MRATAPRPGAELELKPKNPKLKPKTPELKPTRPQS